MNVQYNSPYIQDELNKTTEFLNETLIIDSEDDQAIETSITVRDSRSPLRQNSRQLSIMRKNLN